MDPLNTAALRNRLTNRYATRTARIQNVYTGQPEYAVLFEVPLDGRPRFDGNPDIRSKQRIDAVAVGLWGRTRHQVLGFEIKVSRSDLLRELNDPTKAAAGVAVCDQWWLVLGTKDLLRPNDVIPPDWGILIPHGKGLKALVQAPTLSPTPDTSFLGGLVQAAMRGNSQIARGLGYAAGFEAGRSWANAHPKHPDWKVAALEREITRLTAGNTDHREDVERI